MRREEKASASMLDAVGDLKLIYDIQNLIHAFLTTGTAQIYIREKKDHICFISAHIVYQAL